MAKKFNRRLILSPCSIICHGACEVEIAKYLKQKYRMPVKIFSDDNGKKSIELTGLYRFMHKPPFDSKDAYIQACDEAIEINENGDLVNHKIFIVIDEDGYSVVAKKLLSKELFADHWAKEYIVPILSVRDLDECIIKAGFDLDTHDHKPLQYNYLLKRNDLCYPLFFEKLDKNKTNIIDLISYLANISTNK